MAYVVMAPGDKIESERPKIVMAYAVSANRQDRERESCDCVWPGACYDYMGHNCRAFGWVQAARCRGSVTASATLSATTTGAGLTPT